MDHLGEIVASINHQTIVLAVAPFILPKSQLKQLAFPSCYACFEAMQAKTLFIKFKGLHRPRRSRARNTEGQQQHAGLVRSKHLCVFLQIESRLIHEQSLLLAISRNNAYSS